MTLQCVLFDLDGTLADTAPDLLASLDYALNQRGWPKADPVKAQPAISRGALAMLRASVPEASESELEQLLSLLLDDYQANIARYTCLFPGVDSLLRWLELEHIRWGVVTNKKQRFTKPLMQALALDTRAACIISGDSTAHSKPHPAPMWAACQQVGVQPENCVYIGDARHDIEAGKRSGMMTLAASYGYLLPEDDPNTWGADAIISEPSMVRNWLEA